MALGCDPTIFGEVTADRVDELGCCRTNRSRVETRDLLPAAVALHCDEPHAGVLRRFADRLGIDRVVLLPLHKRLYIGGRDQPNFMAKLGKLTGPVMRSTTCLQRDRAIRLHCKETQQLSSTDPLAEYHSTPLIGSVNMKDVLGDIQTDYDNFDTDVYLKTGSRPPLWHIDAVGGVDPS